MEQAEIISIAGSYIAITLGVHIIAGIEAKAGQWDGAGRRIGYKWRAKKRRTCALVAWLAPLWPVMVVVFLIMSTVSWFGELHDAYKESK